MDKNEALEVAKRKCVDHGHRLLYLTKHGSQLYGTSTKDSDTDYQGIFLPDLKFLVRMNKIDFISEQTKKDRSLKNTKDDNDLKLYSLQFWLQTLVRKGETEGIELLYSYTNRDAVVFCDPLMEEIFFYKTHLFDPRSTEAFIGFALDQARKYFVKAERFNVIKDVWIFLNGMGDLKDGLKLNNVIDEILDQFGHETYCFEVDSNGLRGIKLCGKIHQETISVDEFFGRLTLEYTKYGHRSIRAAELEGGDWKSLSHALKAIFEVRHLLIDGHIDFPLLERDLLRSIKLGEVDLACVEQHIMSGIDEVDQLKTNFPTGLWGYDSEYVGSVIAKFYQL